jgi:hypothetical protein
MPPMTIYLSIIFRKLKSTEVDKIKVEKSGLIPVDSIDDAVLKFHGLSRALDFTAHFRMSGRVGAGKVLEHIVVG